MYLYPRSIGLITYSNDRVVHNSYHMEIGTLGVSSRNESKFSGTALMLRHTNGGT